MHEGREDEIYKQILSTYVTSITKTRTLTLESRIIKEMVMQKVNRPQ